MADSENGMIENQLGGLDVNSRFAAWRIPEYRQLWIGAVIIALANWCQRLAVGWFVLVATDSVFLTAASFAVRQAPGVLTAPLGGGT